MLEPVSRYLDDVKAHLRLDRASESEVIRELETHIEDRLSEMEQSGLSEEEATNTCLRLLGSAKLVARRLYEAQSQTSWRHALMASMPHLLFALLFVLNWWQGIGWVVVSLGLILGTALYGWLHGRPVWLFPWLGYSLLPVIAAGLLLLYLPRGWSWLAAVVYVPLALWLVCVVAIQTIKRDWLYGALMLLPLPVTVGWFLALANGGWLPGFNAEHVRQLAGWIALSFVTLGVTALVFFRVRQRRLRVVLLLASGFLSLVMVDSYGGGGLSTPGFFLLSLILLCVIVSPALLERRLKRSRRVGRQFLPDGEIADVKGGRSG